MNVHARRFPLFDALRGIAAILVVTRHATDHTPAADVNSFIHPFVQAMGGCALAIFFVVSGFLLYRPFLSTHVAGDPRPRLGPYALGRVMRIFPAYWVALTVATIWFSYPLVFSADWWQFYFLVYDYFGRALYGIGPAWSLCIEVAYYVFLPLFVIAIGFLPAADPRARLRNAALGVAGCVAVGLITRIVLVERAGSGGVSPTIIPSTFLDWLGLGMGLAVVSVWVERRGELLPRGLRVLDRFPAAAWAVSVTAFLIAAFVLNAQGLEITRSEPWLAHALYGVFAVSLVAPAALGDQSRGVLRKLLAWRPLLFVGLVSYGIFLWHLPIIQQLANWNLERVGVIHPYILWTATTLVAATAIATVSYYVIEMPAMRLRRRLLGKRRGESPRGEALAEPTGPLVVEEGRVK